MQFALEASDDDATCFGAVLGRGYAAIAAVAASDPDGAAQYRDAVAVFRAQLADVDKNDDAKFGIDQLERVFARHAK